MRISLIEMYDDLKKQQAEERRSLKQETTQKRKLISDLHKAVVCLLEKELLPLQEYGFKLGVVTEANPADLVTHQYIQKNNKVIGALIITVGEASPYVGIIGYTNEYKNNNLKSVVYSSDQLDQSFLDDVFTLVIKPHSG